MPNNPIQIIHDTLLTDPLFVPQQKVEKIGSGQTGEVFKCFNLETGTLVAIKQVSLDRISKQHKDSIKNEIDMLKNYVHPKIVKYLDCISEDADYLNIVLEYVENGSLEQLVSRVGKLTERLAKIYIVQVLSGLEFLHRNDIIHRDIKGGNILATKDGQVKLADFGVATMLNKELNNSNKNMSFAGTPYWMAPEIILQNYRATCACDIWSLGCLVIELLTKRPPYYEMEPCPAMIKIANEDTPMPIPPDISEEAKDFLRQCFQRDPAKRSTAKQLQQHPWLLDSQRQDTQDATRPESTTVQPVVISLAKPIQQSLQAAAAATQNQYANIYSRSELTTHFKQLCKQMEAERKPKHTTLINLNNLVNRFKELHQLSKQSDLQDNAHLLEELGPLRVISVLQASMSRNTDAKDLSINEKCLLAYTTMQLLNLLCDDTPQNYMQMCLAGVFSIIKELALAEWILLIPKEQDSDGNGTSVTAETPRELKVEIAYFVLRALYTCNESVLILFACQGYKILTHFVSLEADTETSYKRNKLLIMVAIDAFIHHLDQEVVGPYLPSTRIIQEVFLHYNIHLKLVKVLRWFVAEIAAQEKEGQQLLMEENEDERNITYKYVEKVFDLLSQLQQGNDESIKLQFCQEDMFHSLAHMVATSNQQLTPLNQMLMRRYLRLVSQVFAPETLCPALLTKLEQCQIMQQLADNVQHQKVTLGLNEIGSDDGLASGSPVKGGSSNQVSSKQLLVVYNSLKLLCHFCQQSKELAKQAANSNVLDSALQLVAQVLAQQLRSQETKFCKLIQQVLTLLLSLRENASIDIGLSQQVFSFLGQALRPILKKLTSSTNTKAASSLEKKVEDKLRVIAEVSERCAELTLHQRDAESTEDVESLIEPAVQWLVVLRNKLALLRFHAVSSRVFLIESVQRQAKMLANWLRAKQNRLALLQVVYGPQNVLLQLLQALSIASDPHNQVSKQTMALCSFLRAFMLLLFKGIDELARQRSPHAHMSGEHLDTDIVSDSDEEGVKQFPGQETDQQIKVNIENEAFFKHVISKALNENQGMRRSLDLITVLSQVQRTPLPYEEANLCQHALDLLQHIYHVEPREMSRAGSSQPDMRQPQHQLVQPRRSKHKLQRMEIQNASRHFTNDDQQIVSIKQSTHENVDKQSVVGYYNSSSRQRPAPQAAAQKKGSRRAEQELSVLRYVNKQRAWVAQPAPGTSTAQRVPSQNRRKIINKRYVGGGVGAGQAQVQMQRTSAHQPAIMQHQQQASAAAYAKSKKRAARNNFQSMNVFSLQQENMLAQSIAQASNNNIAITEFVEQHGAEDEYGAEDAAQMLMEPGYDDHEQLLEMNTNHVAPPDWQRSSGVLATEPIGAYDHHQYHQQLMHHRGAPATSHLHLQQQQLAHQHDYGGTFVYEKSRRAQTATSVNVQPRVKSRDRAMATRMASGNLVPHMQAPSQQMGSQKYFDDTQYANHGNDWIDEEEDDDEEEEEDDDDEEYEDEYYEEDDDFNTRQHMQHNQHNLDHHQQKQHHMMMVSDEQQAMQETFYQQELSGQSIMVDQRHAPQNMGSMSQSLGGKQSLPAQQMTPAFNKQKRKTAQARLLLNTGNAAGGPVSSQNAHKSSLTNRQLLLTGGGAKPAGMSQGTSTAPGSGVGTLHVKSAMAQKRYQQYS